MVPRAAAQWVRNGVFLYLSTVRRAQAITLSAGKRPERRTAENPKTTVDKRIKIRYNDFRR